MLDAGHERRVYPSIATGSRSDPLSRCRTLQPPRDPPGENQRAGGAKQVVDFNVFGGVLKVRGSDQFLEQLATGNFKVVDGQSERGAV